VEKVEEKVLGAFS